MTKQERKKRKEKLERSRPKARQTPIPPSKRHKSKKDYKRIKIKVQDEENY